MKTVLFIAYDFQPCTNIGGSLRSTKFVGFLEELGWRGVVLALRSVAADEKGEVVGDIHRIRSLTPFSKPYQITPYGWAVSMWWKAKKLIQKMEFDLIYVSAPPFPQLISSVFLSRRFNLPLVLDFRDNWSQDPYREGSFLKKFIYTSIFPKTEKWVFENTDALILNTPSSLRVYREMYPEISEKMHLISNGYDESDFKVVTPFNRKPAAMQMLYSGSFGVGGRNPYEFFVALKLANENGMNISLRILGNQPDSIAASANQLGLDEVVEFAGQLQHKDAIDHMYGADVLLLYQEFSEAKVQAIAGKTFEYIRTGKPILSIAPKGNNQDLIKSYAQSYEIVDRPGSRHIYNALAAMYRRWQKGEYDREYLVSEEFSGEYERKSLTSKLAGLFDSVLSERSGSIRK